MRTRDVTGRPIAAMSDRTDGAVRGRGRLRLLVELEPTATFRGRVEVVGSGGGGEFCGWIDFMALVEEALAAQDPARAE